MSYCVYIRDDGGDLDGEIDLATRQQADQAVARLAARGRRDATVTERPPSTYAIDIDWHDQHCHTNHGTEQALGTTCRTIATHPIT